MMMMENNTVSQFLACYFAFKALTHIRYMYKLTHKLFDVSINMKGPKTNIHWKTSIEKKTIFSDWASTQTAIKLQTRI